VGSENSPLEEGREKKGEVEKTSPFDIQAKNGI
jgi:hypothetical protein